MGVAAEKRGKIAQDQSFYVNCWRVLLRAPYTTVIFRYLLRDSLLLELSRDSGYLVLTSGPTILIL